MKESKWFVRVQACMVVILMFTLVFSIAHAIAGDKGQNPNNAEYAQGTSDPASRLAAAASWKAVGKTILIPPGAFTTDGDPGAAYYKTFFGGYFYSTNDNGTTCLVAPVHFPRGTKKIAHAYVYAQDGNASKADWFALDRIDYRTGAVVQLGRVDTTDSVDITEYEIPVSDIKVSEDYLFQLTACLYSGIKIYGAKVMYK